MTPDYDCIVVGSGPAGVSVAFPLLEAGKSVLMVDGGRTAEVPPPAQPYLEARATDDQQWQWFVGDALHAAKPVDGSPKLRVPTQRFAFEGFSQAIGIEARNFNVTGSLAAGGLSNAWGCGVASLSAEELKAFPVPVQDMRSSYARIAKRIGVSGCTDDDLSTYFGVDEWAQQPVALDACHQQLLDRYQRKKRRFSETGFAMGRSRVAVLTESLGDRMSCDLSTNCLWGCHRQATYSAAQDLEKLQCYPRFHYQPGVVVETLAVGSTLQHIHGICAGAAYTASSKRLFLAAGTLGTTAILLRSLALGSPINLQSCPVAAFLLWLPRQLGAARKPAFGLGQLSFTLKLANDETAFGSTFNTTGLPVTEFLRSVPFARRSGIGLMRGLLSSCIVANVFLPGHYSTSTVALTENGAILINGGCNESLPASQGVLKQRLRRNFASLGAFMLPGSFTAGEPGSDIHYAATFPMNADPGDGQTNALGELAVLPGVHIVDGACLPVLTEKSHTLTIMANADRIGQALANSP